jgi:hypothetical protein
MSSDKRTSDLDLMRVNLRAVGTIAPARATDKDREFMAKALKLMRQAGVVDKTGGPFGVLCSMERFSPPPETACCATMIRRHTRR